MPGSTHTRVRLCTLQCRTSLPDAEFRELLVHLLFQDSYHVEFTFSAADDGARVSKAMEYALRTVLITCHIVRDIHKIDDERVRNRANMLDYRVMSGKAWNLVDDDYYGTIFNAGR